MRSLSSRLYKAGFLKASTEVRVIEAKPLPVIEESDHEERSESNIDDIEQHIEIPQELLHMVEDARQQAASIIESAKAEANSLMQDIEAQKVLTHQEIQEKGQQIYQESQEKGYQDGYQLGFAEGSKAAEAEYNGRLDHANQILQAANQQKTQEIVNAQNVIVDLAYEIAKKVVFNNPELLKAQVVDLVTLTLRKIRDGERVEIHVHPDDFATVYEALPIFKNTLAGKSEIIIQAESHIDIGGCHLHTKMGTIDAKITTQFDEIKKALQTLDLGREGIDES